jgi:uncharacterized pyridoxal phosphate-containing UPF0001 family protein
MASIDTRLQTVKGRIANACARAGRDVQSVTLLAVSKTQAAQAVQEAAACGQADFGENYVQEALEKIAALAPLRADLRWHLIGPLQSNKTRLVAEAFDWVHTVDRLKIAQRLSEQRPPQLPPLAHAVAALPRLRLRGLMAIPEPVDDPLAQRLPHRRLAALLAELRAQGLALDTLSTGMSADLEAAIAEGATIVRVGTALFGERARVASAG